MKQQISLTTITLLLAASSLSAATLYVSLESTNPTPPYTNWVSVHLLPSGVCNRSASFGTSASASQHSIATTLPHPPLSGTSPDTRRTLTVSPLIADKRCYGECPASVR